MKKSSLYRRKIITRKWSDIQRRKDCIITLGNFDGVHLGHRNIMSTLMDYSEKTGLEPLAVTFFPHPRLFFKKEKEFELLTAPWEKEFLLTVDHSPRTYFISFDRGFSKLGPDEFVHLFLIKRMRARIIVLGPDYRFGAGAGGDLRFLGQHLDSLGAKLIVVPSVKSNRKIISSSLIRSYLNRGQINRANAMLGYNFFYSGTVVKGDNRGGKLGFPTANVETHCKQKLQVAAGVYGAYAILGRKRLPALVNVGTNPTFKSQKTKIEAHILDFRRNIYGQNITLELNSYFRKEKKFKSDKELVRQIRRDINKFKMQTEVKEKE
ncbi:riboflavin biosynthesis protein RibF [Fibrobacterota bacterium]